MTRAEARTAIQASYENVGGAPSTAELNAWLDIEHKLFRRELSRSVPSLYTTTSSTQALTAADPDFDLPADFDRVVRFERLYGDTYLPVDVSDGLSPHAGDLTFREEGTTLKAAPSAQVAGTYRLVYVQTPGELSAESSTNGVLLVPPGCEDVILERVSARARAKLQEDPTPHLQRAADVWTQQRRVLMSRYGRHGQPGLRVVRGW